MPGQLVFPFGVQPALGRQDFIVAPCNEQAFRFVECWPDWPARAVALYGPTGCGKSHLVEVWRKHSRREDAVALEDIDDKEPSAGRDAMLMALFERPEGTLLLTGRAPPKDWPATLGDLKSRFTALLAFPMWAPDDSLLMALVRKHFADRQIDVPDNVVKRIVVQLERTPAAIAAFVARVDRKAWVDKRAVTERLVVQLLESEEVTQGGE